MKKNFPFALLLFVSFISSAQSFIRSELTTTLTTPWEITLGPDGYLWLTEKFGTISRVDPNTGAKQIVFTAADYSAGFPVEQCGVCHQPNIGSGTHGLALHPDFNTQGNSFVYFVYSYNSGTTTNPSTKFKIARLTWDVSTSSVTAVSDVIVGLPNGFDHLGGRLLAVKQNSINYLYYSTGDCGVSESNSPDCYNPQTLNPNNNVQDTAYKNGKILRYNIDGSIPLNNPIAGSPIFTRGHRNPQGLIFNSAAELVYNTEHGDRTDDEINILESGKNYGWKNIRGYHADNNFPGEAASIANFTPNPGITGDGLSEPLFSWCATPPPTTTANASWCTVAPSDGIYYNFNGSGIPGWDNSLLVVTLKNGTNTDQEVYKFQLTSNGYSLAPSTSVSPNPQRFFAADQALNGRLRDIAISADGQKIYLINNGGTNRDKITVYTLDPAASVQKHTFEEAAVEIFPNPANDLITVSAAVAVAEMELYDILGKLIVRKNNSNSLPVNDVRPGCYVLKITTSDGRSAVKRVVRCD